MWAFTSLISKLNYLRILVTQDCRNTSIYVELLCFLEFNEMFSRCSYF